MLLKLTVTGYKGDDIPVGPRLSKPIHSDAGNHRLQGFGAHACCISWDLACMMSSTNSTG